MIVYDFGAGRRRTPGVISVDINAAYAPEIVADITRNTGIPANSADEVRCNHVLEHIPHPGQFLALQEICRVLKLGGRFIVKVPHPAHDSAMVPGHVHVLAPHYWRDIQREPRAYMGCALVIDSVDESGGEDAAKLLGVPLDVARKYYRNTATETIVRGHKV